jgi:hypothetical protein
VLSFSNGENPQVFHLESKSTCTTSTLRRETPDQVEFNLVKISMESQESADLPLNLE